MQQLSSLGRSGMRDVGARGGRRNPARNAGAGYGRRR
jgi:hypothetical protein